MFVMLTCYTFDAYYNIVHCIAYSKDNIRTSVKVYMLYVRCLLQYRTVKTITARWCMFTCPNYMKLHGISHVTLKFYNHLRSVNKRPLVYTDFMKLVLGRSKSGGFPYGYGHGIFDKTTIILGCIIDYYILT